MALAPDRRRAALLGAGLAVIGISALVYGSILLSSGTHFAGGLLSGIFGVLLTLESVLIFVVPAVYEYVDDITE